MANMRGGDFQVKSLRRICIAGALLSCGLFGQRKYDPVPKEFMQAYFPSHPVLVEPGDVLNLRFYFNPELNKKVTVRPDGKISLDFLQSTQASGMTPDELQQKLVGLYSKEFRDPVITVDLEESAANQVYVTGEVVAPGAKPLHTNMTIGMVLAASQAEQKTAGLKSVFLIRNMGGTYHAYRLDAAFPDGTSRDVYLAPGDILFVPRKFIVKAGDFVEQYIRNILPATPTGGVSVLYTPGNPLVTAASTVTH
jgi:polysaccharide export outer membrane protein